MIKYFCDRCGKEIIATEELALGSEIIAGFMICSDCNHTLKGENNNEL